MSILINKVIKTLPVEKATTSLKKGLSKVATIKPDTFEMSGKQALSLMDVAKSKKYNGLYGAINQRLSKTPVLANILPAKQKLPEGLPEYIYHITPSECYSKIMESGKLKVSVFESMSSNGCKGVYFVGKDNLMNKWMGAKDIDMFGDMDIGELLLTFTGAGGDSVNAIKIPVSSLDLSKLRFRPYLTACRDSVENFDFDKLVCTSVLCKEGLPINELPKYINKEPVEFVYMDEIPKELFSGISTSLGTSKGLSFNDIMNNLFGKSE